jgi:hypothetical protein
MPRQGNGEEDIGMHAQPMFVYVTGGGLQLRLARIHPNESHGRVSPHLLFQLA